MDGPEARWRGTEHPGRWDVTDRDRYRDAVPPHPHAAVDPSGPWRLDRRAFIGTGLAVPAAIWLAACGGDDSGSGGGGDGKLPSSATIVARFPQDTLVPGGIRMPISFEADQTLISDGPATVNASILDQQGKVILDGLSADRIQLAPNTAEFWVVRADVEQTGIYGLAIDGIKEPKAFQVLDRAQVAQPKPGDKLPPFDTPTLDDARGVAPICTRAEGTCPLHTITLTEALTLGKPVAYLISTPAHCQFGVCGPVLDILLAAHETYGDRVTMVHADVYTDDTATVTTPAVQAYALSWEPSLFVADATGTIIDRLDISYSADELDSVLARAGA
jgi:hypothetical protein